MRTERSGGPLEARRALDKRLRDRERVIPCRPLYFTIENPLGKRGVCVGLRRACTRDRDRDRDVHTLRKTTGPKENDWQRLQRTSPTPSIDRSTRALATARPWIPVRRRPAALAWPLVLLGGVRGHARQCARAPPQSSVRRAAWPLSAPPLTAHGSWHREEATILQI